MQWKRKMYGVTRSYVLSLCVVLFACLPSVQSDGATSDSATNDQETTLENLYLQYLSELNRSAASWRWPSSASYRASWKGEIRVVMVKYGGFGYDKESTAYADCEGIPGCNVSGFHGTCLAHDNGTVYAINVTSPGQGYLCTKFPKIRCNQSAICAARDTAVANVDADAAKAKVDDSAHLTCQEGIFVPWFNTTDEEQGLICLVNDIAHSPELLFVGARILAYMQCILFCGLLACVGFILGKENWNNTLRPWIGFTTLPIIVYGTASCVFGSVVFDTVWTYCKQVQTFVMHLLCTVCTYCKPVQTLFVAFAKRFTGETVEDLFCNETYDECVKTFLVEFPPPAVIEFAARFTGETVQETPTRVTEWELETSVRCMVSAGETETYYEQVKTFLVEFLASMPDCPPAKVSLSACLLAMIPWFMHSYHVIRLQDAYQHAAKDHGHGSDKIRCIKEEADIRFYKSYHSKGWKYYRPFFVVFFMMYMCGNSNLTQFAQDHQIICKYWIFGEMIPLILLIIIRTGYCWECKWSQMCVWWYCPYLFTNTLSNDRLWDNSNWPLQSKRSLARWTTGWFWKVDYRKPSEDSFKPGDGDHYLVNESGTVWWCCQHGLPRLVACIALYSYQGALPPS